MGRPVATRGLILLLLGIASSVSAESMVPVALAGAGSLEGPLAIARVPDERAEVAALSGEPLTLRTVSAAGRLSRPRAFELRPAPEQLRPLRVARNAFGDWLLSAGREVRWLRGSKDETLPLPRAALPWDVGFLRDRPVAAVTSHDGEAESVPLLLEWNGRSWQPLVFEPLPAEASEPGPRGQHTAAVLEEGSNGSLWVGFAYRHRLLRVGRTGKVDLEVRVGDARPEVTEADHEAEAALVASAAQRGGPPGRPARTQAFVNTARRMIEGVAEGPDGLVYMLLGSGDAGSSHTLERFDPKTGSLHRTGLSLPHPVPVRMVAGKAGLVLAAENAKRGAWLLWGEAIAGAEWSAVEGAVVSPPPAPSSSG